MVQGGSNEELGCSSDEWQLGCFCCTTFQGLHREPSGTGAKAACGWVLTNQMISLMFLMKNNMNIIDFSFVLIWYLTLNCWLSLSILAVFPIPCIFLLKIVSTHTHSPAKSNHTKTRETNCCTIKLANIVQVFIFQLLSPRLFRIQLYPISLLLSNFPPICFLFWDSQVSRYRNYK